MHADHESIPGVRASRMGSASVTRLCGRWLLIARAVWAVLITLVLTFFIASLPVYFMQQLTVCVDALCPHWQLTPAHARALQDAGLSVSLYAIFSLALSLFSALVWFAVAAFIAWRKANDWMALLTSLFLVTVEVLLFSGGPYTSLEYSSPAWHVPTIALILLLSILYLLVFSLFPNGRFVPGWMPWLVTAQFVLGAIVLCLPTSFSTTGILFTPLTTLLLLSAWAIVIGGQMYRYWRVSTPTERQQTKWVVLGLIEGAVLGVVYLFPPLLFPSLSAPDSLYFLLFKPVIIIISLFTPLCFGIAILRYRLWEIDVLINRTLVYATLTASLTLVYVGNIIALQYLLHGLTQGYDVAIVGSTLVIAALFQPLRRRIQQTIDRRFYRRKYDATRTLAAFSATLRNEVDLDQLREQLVAVVQETMQPAHVSLWLRKSDRRANREAWGVHPLSSHAEQ